MHLRNDFADLEIQQSWVKPYILCSLTAPSLLQRALLILQAFILDINIVTALLMLYIFSVLLEG